MANYHEALATAATPEQRAAWEKQLAYAQQQNGTRVTPGPAGGALGFSGGVCRLYLLRNC